MGRFLRSVREYLGEQYSGRTLVSFISGRSDTLRKIRKRTEAQRAEYSRPGKKRIAHVTSFSVSNAGDNVLSECVRRLFDKRFGELDWDIIRLHDSVDDETIDRLNRTQGVVIGGGGVFLPDTNKNDVSGWQWPFPKERYSEISSPMVVFAVGYNYFNGQERCGIFEDNVSELAARSAFFGLRNHGSLAEISSFLEGDVKSNLTFQPCPTMIARYIYPELPEKIETRKIALNVALDRAGARMGEDQEIILSEIAKAMRLLGERGYEIHFITHCDWEIKYNDYLIREKVKFIYHHATVWDTKKILKFYNDMDIVIGMRGHGIWIPYGVNTRILSLGSHNKTKWFLEDIDALDWNIDVNQDPGHLSTAILDKFISLNEKDRDKTDKKLRETQMKLWDITCENMDAIGRLTGLGQR